MRISDWSSDGCSSDLLDAFDLSALRLLLFAGEVFPMKHLAALRGVAPRPRYYNLYGPTETNVCTFFEADDSTIREEGRPLPIGRVCSGDDALVLDPDGRVVSARSEEHTSELQSLMRISYAVFCLQK